MITAAELLAEPLRELSLPEICSLSRLGVDLLMAPEPLRDLTKDERKQALKALGVDPNSTVEMRVCTRCEAEKPITEYHVKGWDDAGPLYNRMCKHCCQARQAAYRRNKPQ